MKRGWKRESEYSSLRKEPLREPDTVHQQPITHGVKASAQRSPPAPLIGHIQLLTPLLTGNQVRGGSQLSG